jgi:hypothetical protein
MLGCVESSAGFIASYALVCLAFKCFHSPVVVLFEYLKLEAVSDLKIK